MVLRRTIRRATVLLTTAALTACAAYDQTPYYADATPVPEDSVAHKTAELHDPQIEDAGEITILRWYDAQRDADVTLQVEAATGLPRLLRQAARATGAVVTVSYNY